MNPKLEVAIDDGKLSRKYNEIYYNIRALGFASLIHPGNTVNVNLVKESYANRQPKASLDVVYEVCVRALLLVAFVPTVFLQLDSPLVLPKNKF